ncbi:MAG: 2Fe-2S iron-sulfur cluster-binding protein [Novosphingobium sp.]
MPLRFRFDGRHYQGFQGDTLASALLANGVRLVGRSFKYHRPRGFLTADDSEPNGLAEIGIGARREPNIKMPECELADGLIASSQNRLGSLRHDLLAFNGLAAPILGAGFYYKTFMWPSSFWERLYEPVIRRAAGLGRAATAPDPDVYEKATLHCDALIIGCGPAGLAAAIDAVAAGARVLACERDFETGGSWLSHPDRAAELADLQHRAVALVDAGSLTILTRTHVLGAHDGGIYSAVEKIVSDGQGPSPRQRLLRIVAGRAILATGAREQPLVFRNNDRPGIMLAGAVRTYIDRFAVRPGTRAAIYTDQPDIALTVEALKRGGIDLACIVDARDAADPPVGADGVMVVRGCIADTRGGEQLKSVTVRGADGTSRRLDCDLLIMAGRSLPERSLYRAGPGGTAMVAVGGAAQSDGAAPDWPIDTIDAKAFVDFQNDVTAADIRAAANEGFSHPEHLKRYTTLGMATDQGRTSSANGLALLSKRAGRSQGTLQPTQARWPAVPVAIGALAGHHREAAFRPLRRTPTDQWAEQRGAAFTNTGLWRRASYFPRGSETGWLESAVREARAVREGVGFCDVSTLGKYELFGPDAGTLLDRVYANMFSSLAVGKARYGIMLREDGIAYDDGTTARLAEHHYVMTTSSAMAESVGRNLEYCRQILWPELDVVIVPVTEQWAQVAIAGPQSRALLQQIVDDPSSTAGDVFPHMSARNLTVLGGTEARLFRLSFSGEMAFELAVPGQQGNRLAAELEALGGTPYGLEALNILRLEKGHVTGAEIDGRNTAFDLGLGKMLSKKKDFIGRRMAERPALNESARPRLVGLRSLRPDVPMTAGAQLVVADDVGRPQGWVSSIAYSPAVADWIGIGLLEHGPERHGEELVAWNGLQGEKVAVVVVDPIFYDPAGERARG